MNKSYVQALCEIAVYTPLILDCITTKSLAFSSTVT